MSRLPILPDSGGLVRSLARCHVWVLRAAQLAFFIFGAISAFLLRFDFNIPGPYHQHLWFGLSLLVAAKVLVFHSLTLDRGSWQFVSVPDLLRLGVGNLAGSVLACAAILLWAPSGFPRSLYILDFLLCSLLTGSARLAVRIIFEFSRRQSGVERKRTLIYGAGAAGEVLLRELRQNPSIPYRLIGFIDDDPLKLGSMIHRLKILGNGQDLPHIVREQQIGMVLIAVPRATGQQMAAILEHCHRAEVSFKTVPSLAEVIESAGLASQIRDVAVDDLLGRNPIQLDESTIRQKIEGKVIVVTGAAGSIGSELCRQIARFRPAALVAYECAETALFYLEREMCESLPELAFHAEIGDIRDLQRLHEVFAQYQPAIVYHAAAYKHVPMMESNVFEAVENNVIGTCNVALAAAQYAVRDFVMISSDKAVRPTSIMGATKRVAEILIHSLNGEVTNYVSVRFGNVLGSNGSVIPIFKKQIAARKPLTITHPEMRRYFMTIPEAAQLVVQASTMGHGGEIFVLDMGEQVRIVDLARNLILLSGLQPEHDIPIRFTGVRPGEKLFEEVAHVEEETLPTYHPKIKIFANRHNDRAILDRIEQLRYFCGARDFPGLLLQLKELIPDYNPSSQVLRRAVHTATSPAGTARKAQPLTLIARL
ncbi:MAG TPA: nucleoside-diphosphate sugar epimerase/dehydratase [Bryobacteraceae bacterium]|nr:nucleoside-diphosphate sugar epimerase/dehydratase [Bryobacteraceae bacterium]